MRFEVIMKSETCYRIYDNEKRKWCEFVIDGKKVSEFSTREEAFINLDVMNAGAL